VTVTTASGVDLEGSVGGAEVVAGASGAELLARAVEVVNVVGMMVADSSWRRTPGMVKVAVDEAAGEAAEVEVPREGFLAFEKKEAM
jgi:hypothetical protein